MSADASTGGSSAADSASSISASPTITEAASSPAPKLPVSALIHEDEHAVTNANAMLQSKQKEINNLQKTNAQQQQEIFNLLKTIAANKTETDDLRRTNAELSMKVEVQQRELMFLSGYRHLVRWMVIRNFVRDFLTKVGNGPCIGASEGALADARRSPIKQTLLVSRNNVAPIPAARPILPFFFYRNVWCRCTPRRAR